MPLLEMTREQKRAALNELRQAIFQHDLWYESFNRTIICNQVPDERDLAEDAHKRWPFGKWLHGNGAALRVVSSSFRWVCLRHAPINLFSQIMSASLMEV
jgi:diguanylate cyclase